MGHTDNLRVDSCGHRVGSQLVVFVCASCSFCELEGNQIPEYREGSEAQKHFDQMMGALFQAPKPTPRKTKIIKERKHEGMI